MIIAALCQLREDQIVRTMEALEPSAGRGQARLHTYLPVDPILMKASLGVLADHPSKLVETVYRLVSMATKSGFEVEFSAEGYSMMKENFSFTTDVIRAAVSAGARIINCPDTIGGASRWSQDFFVKHMIQHEKIIRQEFPDHKVIWSAHCHNDLGLALDNTMAAIFDGPARQVEGCINGVGERAGNLSLEQCIMVIEQFGKKVDATYEFFTDIHLEKLSKISDFVAKKMLIRQPHWPITGMNSAKHSAGGHTNAILKNPMAYQPFDPQQVGQSISFVFGPLSGGNHVKEILERHGYSCSHKEKAVIAQAIKEQFANRRKGITDAEVIEGFKCYREKMN
jgi:2-isopropylmalate synthase